MHTILSSLGITLLVLLGVAAVLSLVLLVMVLTRAVVRVGHQLHTDDEQPPRFFADVPPNQPHSW